MGCWHWHVSFKLTMVGFERMDRYPVVAWLKRQLSRLDGEVWYGRKGERDVLTPTGRAGISLQFRSVFEGKKRRR